MVDAITQATYVVYRGYSMLGTVNSVEIVGCVRPHYIRSEAIND